MTQTIAESIPTYIELLSEYNQLAYPITAIKIVSLIDKIDLAKIKADPAEKFQLKELRKEILNKYVTLGISYHERQARILKRILDKFQTSF